MQKVNTLTVGVAPKNKDNKGTTQQQCENTLRTAYKN